MRREHLCILGMGDCGSKTTIKEFNETVNENLTQTMISKVRQTSGSATGTQQIKFQRINCTNVNIGDISQKMVIKYDFSRILQTTDATQLRNIIKSAVEQGANASTKTKSEFMSGGAGSQSNVEIMNKNITRVTDSYTFNDFTNDINQAIASQQVGFSEISGTNCNFGNISQEIYLEMLIKQMSDQVTQRFGELVAENEARQKTQATSESEATGIFTGIGGMIESVGTMVGNIFSTPIYLMIGIILFVVMIGMVIKLFSGSSGDEAALTAAMLAQQSAEFEQYDEPIPGEENPNPTAPVEVGDESTEEVVTAQ